MNLVKNVIANLENVDLRTRWNHYYPFTGVRQCDMVSLLILSNGHGANLAQTLDISAYWFAVMREHFPKDILMVDLGRTQPIPSEEIPY